MNLPHVDLVEGSEHGSSVLRLLQTLSNTGTHGGHTDLSVRQGHMLVLTCRTKRKESILYEENAVTCHTQGTLPTSWRQPWITREEKGRRINTKLKTIQQGRK